MRIKSVQLRDAARIHNQTVSFCAGEAFDFTLNKTERWVGIIPKVPVSGLGLTIIPFENVKSIQAEPESEGASDSRAAKAKKDSPSA